MAEQHILECSSCSNDIVAFEKIIRLLNTADYPRYNKAEWDEIYSNVFSEIASLPKADAQIISIKPPFTFPTLLRAVAATMLVSVVSFTAFKIHTGNEAYPKIVAISGSAYSAASGNLDSRMPAQNNRMIPPGRSIETDDGASVELKVDKGSTIRIGKNSRLSVEDFAAKRTILSLENGDILAQVSKRTPDQLFRIETPNAFCEVIGTRFNVVTQHDKFRSRYITMLIVREGLVQFGSGTRQLSVKAGNAAVIFGDSIGTPLPIDDPLINQLQQRPGYGQYRVTSNPSEAQVSIDGIPCGVTPYTGSLPYGNHEVTCSKNDFSLWSGTLQIDAHRIATLDIVLTSGTPETRRNPVVLAGNDVFNNPILQSAVSRINAGDYRNALAHLDKIIGDRHAPANLRAAALAKASLCYKHTGDYSGAARMLGLIIDGKFTDEQRGNALFERASIYQTILNDVSGAVADLDRYIKEFGSGIWIEEATGSIAELLYYARKFKDAARHYQDFCDKFTKNSTRERALYRLAVIYAQNLDEPARGLAAFNRLILEFPSGPYAEDALFWSADCLYRLGKTSGALTEFALYAKRYPAGKWTSEVTARLKRHETAGVK